MKCLENLIGISDTDCLCMLEGLTQEQINAAKNSVSGLYLDRNLEGGINVADIKNLDGCGEYYRLASEAIKAAKVRFESDIEMSLGRRYKNQKPTFRGDLGRMNFSASLNKSKNFQFMKLTANASSDAVLRIYGGKLILNADDTVRVYILAQRGLEVPEVIFTTEMQSVANKFTGFALPEKSDFPLTIDGEKMSYYFVWEGSEGTAARDNELSCKCSGGNAYDQFVKLKGGESDSLNVLEGTDGYAHGFSLTAEIKCDTGLLVSREFNSQNKIAVASAWANLYKAGEILIEKVLNSSTINRITLMNRDYLYGKRNHFRARYDEFINYLAYEIDVTKGDCFICNDKNFFVGNVFG